MINEKELASIDRLDELSLYLEISKCKYRLDNLKYEKLSGIQNEKLITDEEVKTREYLNNLLSNLPKYGIDPTDKNNLNNWINACSTFVNNLDIVDHVKFVQLRKEGKRLDLLLSQEEGKSAFLKDDTKEEKEHKLG